MCLRGVYRNMFIQINGRHKRGLHVSSVHACVMWEEKKKIRDKTSNLSMLTGQRRLHFVDNARRAYCWMCDSPSHFWLGGLAQGETWLSIRRSGAEVNSPCSAGKQVWKQLVWGQLSVCSVCHINHSPLPSIDWPVADLTAATGSNTLISETVSPFSQCQVGQQKRESGKK